MFFVPVRLLRADPRTYAVHLDKCVAPLKKWRRRLEIDVSKFNVKPDKLKFFMDSNVSGAKSVNDRDAFQALLSYLQAGTKKKSLNTEKENEISMNLPWFLLKIFPASLVRLFSFMALLLQL